MTRTLADEDVAQATTGVLGPSEVKFRGRWKRVEDALEGLEHDEVRYRWSTDSSGEPAFYIEIPVPSKVPEDTLLERRSRVRDALNDAELEFPPVYIHFVDASTPSNEDA